MKWNVKEPLVLATNQTATHTQAHDKYTLLLLTTVQLVIAYLGISYIEEKPIEC